MSNGFEITLVKAREILDSRGNPTVEAEVHTLAGGIGRASVPSGASTGAYEALEVRNGDQRRFKGKGVLKAVENVNKIIAPALIGLDSRKQEEVDNTMISLDGTANKSKLGANAILSVSLATAKAAAGTLNKPLYKYLGGDEASTLPVPLMNIINGGKHAGNQLALQEFMIIPVGFKSFNEALRAGVEVYQSLKNVLKKLYGASAINVGDEGGFAPPMKLTEEALQALMKAISDAGYTEDEVMLGLDCAASSFYVNQKEVYLVDGEEKSRDKLFDYYLELISRYPILSIEDPFEENDFQSFSDFTREVGKHVQVVGDDLFVTNINRLKQGVSMKAANALLLKVNQIGTLSEAIAAAKYAFENSYNVIVSHRSGETEDPFIADLAVALNTGQIKTGAPARGERTAKYNQLLRIEEELEAKARYPGKEAFKKRLG
ncbi:MAG: phosphopyruvate hydratase [Candidatus Methanomethylicota archaeon]|uniref:Enolase n=1 Tax=Thermoproteota archaeon TaxID=2056631 RepID=A0A497ES43_9CREN|nr:MAG: phosphopyruvate hydratase [Candidatus Verstraetearchaeota archaeon]